MMVVLLKKNIITISNKCVNFRDIYPEEFLPDADSGKVNHITFDPIHVTDIAERVDIMDRVSNSRSRALVFWRFSHRVAY